MNTHRTSRIHRILSALLVCALLWQQMSFLAQAAPMDAPPTQENTPTPAPIGRKSLPAPARSTLSNFFADLNGDQRVDGNDLALLAQSWDCAQGDACYSADLDFDSNGVIDALDLAAVGNEFDIEPPVIAITAPTENAVLTGDSVQVQGTVSDEHTVAQVLVNGVAAALNGNSFSANVPTGDGALLLHVAAVDAIGQAGSASRLVTVDGEGPFITVHSPPHRQAVYSPRPTISISYTDRAASVVPNTLQVTLTDENGGVTDITGQLAASADGASGAPAANLLTDQRYILTVQVADANGNVGSHSTTFYVPPDPASITPPVAAANAGFVSGVVYDSTTCGGSQAYDPIDCDGVAGATVTLEAVDVTALAVARQARQVDLIQSRTALGLPSIASQPPAPVARSVQGTIVTGPDGFFAFPVAATGVYAVRVEKDGFTYGQRLTDVVLEKSTPTTDIFLTPLDPAVTPCDDAGCQHTSADGQMQLDIPAGAIPTGETLDVRATQFDQVQFLPSGELPPGTGETYAFNLSGAAEITFTQPITVMVKNDRGFAPGAPIPLGYWNQELQVWEHAGEAVVNETGEWLVMAVTHFSNFDPNDPVSNATAQASGQDKTSQPGENCAKDCDSSQIELDTGALRQAFSLPGVRVLGESLGVTLLYDSLRPNPTAVIDIELSLQAIAGADLGEFDLIMAELFIEGQSTEQFSFRVDELEEDGEIGRFRFFWDGKDAQGRSLPPGLYFYSVRVRIPYTAEFFFSLNGRFGGPPDLTRPTGVTTTAFIDAFVSGNVLLKREPESHLGHGWQVADVQRLHVREDGSALIDDGNHVQTSYLLPRFDLLNPPSAPGLRLAERLGATTAQGMARLVPNGDEDALTQPAATPSSEQLTEPAADTQPSAAAPRNTPVNSDILTDTVWSLAGSPYQVQNDITIDASATLTVEAGVVVNIISASTVRPSIFVEGNLLVTGTVTNPVIFTSRDDNDNPSWGGIVVQSGGNASLAHAEVRFGGDGPATLGRNASVVAMDSTLSLDHVLILDSTNTINTPDACLHISNSQVTLNAVTLDQCGSPGNDDRAALDIVGSTTAITATGGLTVTNSNHYVLATQWDLLDQLPALTTDGSGRVRIRILNSAIGGDLTISPVGALNVLDFNQNVSIGAGRTVTVTAGMQIQAMGSQNNIDVLGKLVTRGADGNPVIFTSDDNDPGNDGGAEWGRIFINGGAADLDFTTIRFGGNIPSTTTNRAVLAVNGGALTLTNSLLFRNGDTATQEDAFLHSENSVTRIDNSVLTHDGLANANPRRGIDVVGDGGSFSMSNSTVEHRFNPLRIPLSHLAGVDQSNTFNTDLDISRFELAVSTLTRDLTIRPFSGLASYHYFGALTVVAGSTLTVTAGTKLQAQNNVASGLLVNGRLVVQGTAGENVLFTSQSELGNKGEWGGILIDGGAADIEFATIRFGGQRTIPGASANAALAVRNGELRLANSLLFQNGDTSPNDDAPLYIENSEANILGNTISQATVAANPAYGLILVDGDDMALTFNDNIIAHPTRPLRSPLALLQQIGATNHLANDNGQRIGLSDTNLTGSVALGPVAGVAIFEFLNPLTVSGDWTIQAGTTLRSSFSNRGITLNGATLTAIGAPDAPIIFEKQFAGATTWPGIIAQNGAVVRFEHVHMRQAAAGIAAANSQVFLLNSRFTENATGLRLNAGAVPGFFARGNDFEGNTNAAVQNSSGVLVDMRLNFWGSVNGPVHPANPGGDGDTILGGQNVQIDPFLRASSAVEGNTAVNLTPHDTTTLVFDVDTATFTRHYPDGSIVQFDAAGRHDFTRDTNGNEIRYTYNADNSLASMSFVASGRGQADWTWNFTYADARTTQRTVTITDPAGRVTTLGIDKNGDLVSWQEPGLDSPMTFAYGRFHNMTHKTDARGHTTTYEYDAGGRITRSLLPPREIFDPATGQFSIVQETHDFAPGVTEGQVVNDLAAGAPETPNDPLPTSEQIVTGQTINGRAMQFQTNEFGAPTGFTDALGNRSAYERDERDNVIKMTFPSGICTEFTYDEIDNITSETVLAADQCDLPADQRDPARMLRTTRTYEPRFNRGKSITDALARTTTFVYDYEVDKGEAGNLVQIIRPPVEDGESAGRALVSPTESFEYNAFGQVTRHVDARGVATCFVYTTGDAGEAGTLFQPGVTPVPGLVTQEIEDCGGPLERRFTFTDFNASGRALTEREYVGTAQERTTTYTVDARDRVVQEIDPLGNVYAYDFDNADNVIRETKTGHDGQVEMGEYTYNPLNDVTRITEIGDDGQRREMVFGYDLDRNETLSQDFNGNQERSFFDANNRLVRTVDAAGNVTTLTYDGDGRTLTVTDPRGAVRRFEYDVFGRQTAFIDDDGGLSLATRFAYDAVGNTVTITDANGVRTCFEYDNLDRQTRLIEDCGGLDKATGSTYTLTGLPVATTDALGRSKRLVYDRLGRAVQSIDALGNSASMAYDAADNLVTATNEVGQVMTFDYDIADRLVRTTDALGGEVNFAYDAFDQILSMTDELGRTYGYEYDGINRLAAVIDPANGRSSYTFDANDNLLTQTDPLGATTHFTYDAFDQVIAILRPDGASESIAYDANLNKVRVTDSFGNATQYTYDAADRLIAITDRAGAQTTYELDGLSNLLRQTDALGNVNQQVLDTLYRVTQLIRPNGESVSYAYDLMGNLLTLTDGVGNTTTYTYDALDRELTATNPLGQARHSEYAVDGMLTRFVDRNGNDFRFTYDGLRRLVQEIEQTSGMTRTLTYDAAGQLVGAQDANSRYEMAFDSRGNQASIEGTFTTGAPSIRYDYSADGLGNIVRRAEQVNGVQTASTDFGYDAMQRMVHMTQRSAVTKRIEMQYDANGRRTRLDRLHNGALAVSTQWTHAVEGFVTALTHTPAQGGARSYAYSYDAINRITARNSPDGQSTYGYDAFDQVTAATHTFQSDESYSYNDNGSRTLAGYVTAADNRLTSDGVFNYEYDAEGNRTRRIEISTGATVDYTWDHLNRLVGVVSRGGDGAVVQTASYTYDVFNHRIRKTVDGVTEHYGYDGPHLTLVLDADGVVTNRYLYGPQIDMVLADEQISGGNSATRWLLAEVNGTIADLLDAGGGLLNRITYDSFGNITGQTDGNVQTRWGYTGRERDPETGLYQVRTRYYDPGTGQFIAQDQLGFTGGDTNLYRYALNDAVNDRDPFGTRPGPIEADARAIAQTNQQAIGNNVQPTRKPVQPGFLDRIVNAGLDTVIFLTDNPVVNAADQFISGQASSLTAGLTDMAREKIYGEHATKNHTGGFRTAGEILGFAQSFFIPGANAANVAKVRVLLQAGQQGKAALLALGQAIRTAQGVGAALKFQEMIDQIMNDDCLSENQKAQKIADAIANTRMPKVRAPGKEPPPPQKKNKPPLQKTRQRNREKAKEDLAKKRQADEDARYAKEMKDYLRKRSEELRKKEALKFIENKQKELDPKIRNEAKQIVDQEIKNRNISKEAGEKLKKQIDETTRQDLGDTDIRDLAKTRGREEIHKRQMEQINKRKEIERQMKGENTNGGGPSLPTIDFGGPSGGG